MMDIDLITMMMLKEDRGTRAHTSYFYGIHGGGEVII